MAVVRTVDAKESRRNDGWQTPKSTSAFDCRTFAGLLKAIQMA